MILETQRLHVEDRDHILKELSSISTLIKWWVAARAIWNEACQPWFSIGCNISHSSGSSCRLSQGTAHGYSAETSLTSV